MRLRRNSLFLSKEEEEETRSSRETDALMLFYQQRGISARPLRRR
jgi:hypothetical protein